MKANIFPDPRQRHPEVPMTEEEAQYIMYFERETNHTLSCKTAVEAALKILRATDEERRIICTCLC